MSMNQQPNVTFQGKKCSKCGHGMWIRLWWNYVYCKFCGESYTEGT